MPEILFHNKVEVSSLKLRGDGHLTCAAHGFGITKKLVYEVYGSVLLKW